MLPTYRTKVTRPLLLGASLGIALLAGCKPSPKGAGQGADSSTDSLLGGLAAQGSDSSKTLAPTCEALLKRLDSLVAPLSGELESYGQAIGNRSDSLSKEAALLDLQASWGKFDSMAIGAALASPEYSGCASQQEPPYEDTLFTGRAKAHLRRGGLAIVSEEGMASAVPALFLRQDLLKPGLTAVSGQYLKLLHEEARNPVAKDGGIVIPIVDVAARLQSWDSLANAQPASPLAAQAKEKAATYLALLIFGADNTPAFEEGLAVESFRNAWKQAAAGPVQGPSHQLLKDWYVLISKSNFRQDGNTRAWLKQQGLRY